MNEKSDDDTSVRVEGTMKPKMFIIVLILLLASGAVVAWAAPQNFPLLCYKVFQLGIGALFGWIINEMFLQIRDERAQAILVGFAMVSMTLGV